MCGVNAGDKTIFGFKAFPATKVWTHSMFPLFKRVCEKNCIWDY